MTVSSSCWFWPDLLRINKEPGRHSAAMNLKQAQRWQALCKRQQWAGVHVGLTAEFKCTSPNASSSCVHAHPHVPHVWLCVGSRSLIKTKKKAYCLHLMAVIQFVAALGSCHSRPCLRELWKFVFWWQLWDKKAIERDRLRGVNTDAHLSVWEKREKLCVCVCFTCLCVLVWSEVSDQEQLDRSWSIASGHATLSGPVLVVCDKKKRESKCFFLFWDHSSWPGLLSSMLVLRPFLHWFGIWK